jgi:hypothetical protein
MIFSPEGAAKADPELNLHLSQDQVPQMSRPNSLIWGHILDHNYYAGDLVRDVAREFDPLKAGKNKHVRLKLAGLPGIGKSSTAAGIIEQLQDILPGVVIGYHDMIDTYRVTDRLQGITPGITTQPRNKFYYENAAAVDSQIKQLFLRGIPGQKILVEEIGLWSQNFDRKGRVFGVKRGDLGDISHGADNNEANYLMAINMPEQIRRKIIMDREMIKNAPLEDVLDVQKKIGITDLIEDPEAINRRYAYYSSVSAWKQVKDLLSVMRRLIREGLVKAPLPEFQSFSSLINYAREYPPVVNTIIERELYPFLSRGLRVGEAGSGVKMFELWQNPSLPEGTVRLDPDVFLHGYRVIPKLQNYAVEKAVKSKLDPFVTQGLICLQIPLESAA